MRSPKDKIEWETLSVITREQLYKTLSEGEQIWWNSLEMDRFVLMRDISYFRRIAFSGVLPSTRTIVKVISMYDNNVIMSRNGFNFRKTIHETDAEILQLFYKVENSITELMRLSKISMN
jgi:hypothetical protein